MKALALLACLLSSPASASMCVAFQADQFSGLDWTGAEHYDSYTGAHILAAMNVIDGRAVIDLDLVPVPKIDALYAMPVGSQVLLIRVIGTKVCADDPVAKELFDSAKFWVLPGGA